MANVNEIIKRLPFNPKTVEAKYLCDYCNYDIRNDQHGIGRCVSSSDSLSKRGASVKLRKMLGEYRRKEISETCFSILLAFHTLNYLETRKREV